MASNSLKQTSQQGAVMVEMALTLGIFMVILLALFEFALLMFTWSKAVEATRLGSRLAVVSTPVVPLSTLDCDVVQRIDTTCAAGACAAIETRMRGLLPQLNASQIHISYACSEVGYSASPGEYQVYDVTVSIRDFRTTLAMPGLLGFPLEMTMPDFSTSRTSEDLHTP